MLFRSSIAFRNGYTSVKLYFMMGLPTETDEDIVGIARLAEKVARKYKEVTGRWGVTVTISVSCFVPKPHTPFQWYGQLPEATGKLRRLFIRLGRMEQSSTAGMTCSGMMYGMRLLPNAALICIFTMSELESQRKGCLGSILLLG